MIVDGRGRVAADAMAFGPGGNTIVATTSEAPHDVQIAWKEAGAEVLVLPVSDRGVDLRALVSALGEREMTEVLCEGGAALATSLLADGLVNRMIVHVGNAMVGAGPALGDIGISTMTDAPRWSLEDVARTGSTAVLTYLRAPG